MACEDTAANSHIISEKWLHNYKVIYRYEVRTSVLKKAGDNVLLTSGMVDLESKVGNMKVTMRKNAISSLDLNILSTYALYEQGWKNVRNVYVPAKLRI